MKKKFSLQTKNNLARKQLFYILCISSILTLIISCFQIYWEYRKDKTQINKMIQSIKDIHLQTLTRSLWELDEKQIQIQLNDILKMDDIIYLEVKEKSNRYNIFAGENLFREYIVKKDFKMIYPKGKDKFEHIGNFLVIATLKNVNQHLQDRVILILFAQGLKTFIVSICILIIIYLTVTRHLIKISEYAHNLNISDLALSLTIDKKKYTNKMDEIDKLVFSINQMRQTIKNDIENRIRIESKLKEAENRYRMLFQSISDALLVVDTENFDIFDANDAAVELYGYDYIELINLKATDLSAEKDKSSKTLKFGSGKVPLRYHVKKDGTVFPVEISFNFIHINGKRLNVGIIRDITERLQIEKAEKEKQELEKRLQQSKNLETIGILAGGIAHEFNNLLYVITGNSDLLLEDQTIHEENREIIEEILNSSKRGANLVNQLLAFSKKSESKLYPVQLNNEIRDVYEKINKLCAQTIDIKLNLCNDLHLIKADKLQLEQVIINLCNNSRDAMPDGGSLIIKTENTIINDQFVLEHPLKNNFLKVGQYVVLTILDTGFGMNKKTKEHIFDPFFTTKEVGKGTGLGLSVVYGIVETHNGFISCASEIGMGTTFSIYFPAVV